MNKIGKKLFAFDMDGTLFEDSATSTVSNNTKETIKGLINDGHIVSLFTGRPWRASEKTYKELGLDTIIVNFNGAYIHHPKDYTYMPVVETIPLNSVIRILDSSEIKKIAQNIVVEGPQYLFLEHEEKSHFTDAFIQTEDKSIIQTPIDYSKIFENPTGVLIEVKKKYASSVSKISELMKANFGDLVSFSYWETGKGNNPILEFTNFRAKKDIALIKVARYYNIKMKNTIAFGDGYNDIRMLKIAGVGIAMKNSSNVVKSYANVISRHTNKENGVSKFINWYLKGGYDKVSKTMYSFDDPTSSTEQIDLNDRK